MALRLEEVRAVERLKLRERSARIPLISKVMALVSATLRAMAFWALVRAGGGVDVVVM